MWANAGDWNENIFNEAQANTVEENIMLTSPEEIMKCREIVLDKKDDHSLSLDIPNFSKRYKDIRTSLCQLREDLSNAEGKRKMLTEETNKIITLLRIEYHCSEEEVKTISKILQERKYAIIKKLDIHCKTQHCEKLQKELESMREFIGLCKKELGEEVKERGCPVCFDNDIEYAFVPCGHTICRTCRDKYRTAGNLRSTCPSCRSHSSDIMKLFL